MKNIVSMFTVSAILFSGSAVAGSAQGTGDAAKQKQVEVMALTDWQYDEIYRVGWSAKAMLDEAKVFGLGGEEIDTVENIIIGLHGKILSIIAEVGGFWDIGDTHVNIPWNRVGVESGWRVNVPVTEATVDDFSLYADEILTTQETGTIREVDDDVLTGRPWKATQLINDYARLADGTFYGYVDDVIFDSEDRLTAVVATPDTRFGTGGYRAYPFYGYGYGFNPMVDYYQFPYSAEDIGDLDIFVYDSLPRS